MPQWYDVDVVRGTQYTVSGYNVKVDTPTEQGQEVRGILVQPGRSFSTFYRNLVLLWPQVYRRWSYNLARRTSFVCVVSTPVEVVSFQMWQLSRLACLDFLVLLLPSELVRSAAKHLLDSLCPTTWCQAE